MQRSRHELAPATGTATLRKRDPRGKIIPALYDALDLVDLVTINDGLASLSRRRR